MKLTRNDKFVLKYLIKNGRTQDSEIAKKLKITPQAVGKIRKKLESSGVIKEYSTIVDYEKLGITVVAVVLFRFTAEARKTILTEEDINERIKGPNIVNFYRIPEGDVTHIVSYGFRSLEELDHYFHVLQTERGHISEIKRLYVLSAKSLRKNSDKELLINVIDDLGKEAKLARPIPPKLMERFTSPLQKKSLADVKYGEE